MDQLEITVYAKARSLSCWHAKRLLGRKGYAFEVVAVADDGETPAWRVGATGREGLPAVFVDGRLVGGLATIKALERAAELDRLVRGEV